MHFTGAPLSKSDLALIALLTLMNFLNQGLALFLLPAMFELYTVLASRFSSKHVPHIQATPKSFCLSVLSLTPTLCLTSCFFILFILVTSHILRRNFIPYFVLYINVFSSSSTLIFTTSCAPESPRLQISVLPFAPIPSHQIDSSLLPLIVDFPYRSKINIFYLIFYIFRLCTYQ